METLILAAALSVVAFQHIEGGVLTEGEQEMILETCKFNELDVVQKYSKNGYVYRIECGKGTNS